MFTKNSKSILFTCLALVVAVAGIDCVWAMVQAEPAVAALHGEVSLPMAKATTQSEAKSYERPRKLCNTEETLLYKSQFIISYNGTTRCPNYVCWSLTSSRAKGRVRRSNNFHADNAVGERSRVDAYDYSGSGYDRGHMCPAGDNKNSIKAMDESFCMTNICPQNHQLNIDAWNELGVLCRSWAKDYGTVYICCGPIFDQTTPITIGRRKDMKVAVPDRFFKVVLTLGRVPKAMGFIYPNRPCFGDVRDYAVSVDNVENETGMDFFYQLDDKLERRLEAECNPAAWGI